MKERWQLLPPLSAGEYAALKAHIEAFGILTPVVVDADTGELLDGHHRARIAEELDLELPIREHRCGSDAARQAYARGVNIEGRHLSPEQVAEFRQEQRSAYLQLREQEWTQEDAATAVGIPRQTGSDWEVSIAGSGKAYRDQRVSVPREFRDEIADRALAGEPHAQIAADYHVSRPRISQIVAQVVAARQEPEPARTPGYPDGPFSAIVIDPPWPMPKIEREERVNQGRNLDYSTLPIDCGEEKHCPRPLCCITGLPISRLADPRGCHLYLWTTHKFLPDALDLVERWRARYQCLLTWNKNVGITPFSWMYDTEHVVFANLGEGLALQRKGLRLSMSAPAQGHSVKPDVFYERVLEASPEPRLEMFARTHRPGFTAWGSEVATSA